MLGDVASILMKIGLTKREAQVYLACQQYDSLSATSIARITSIPRASVYDLLSKLVAGGYITQVKHHKKTTYRAVAPHTIYLMLNEKKNALEDKLVLFKDNLSHFEALKNFSGVVPQIQYYEGHHALDYFFQQIAQASFSYSIFSLDDLLEHVYYDVENILQKLSHPGIAGAKRIMSFSPTAQEYISRQTNSAIERKLLPEGYTMAAEITLFDNVLLQMSFGQTPSILEIKHPIYYKAHKTIFDFMRNSL